jgi:predicted HTH domain antitoxin
MSELILELESELLDFLAQLNQPVEKTAREMIIMDLFRRGVISGGKASELLDIPRLQFIKRASALGIPYLRFTEEEWEDEIAESERL